MISADKVYNHVIPQFWDIPGNNCFTTISHFVDIWNNPFSLLLNPPQILKPRVPSAISENFRLANFTFN